MSGYIVKRLLTFILVIFIVSVFVFTIMRALPGDPVRLAMGFDASQEDVDRVREEYHFNDPLLDQYTNWIGDLTKGNLGYSFAKKRPVADILSECLPRTIAIGLPAIVISTLLGTIAGVASALKRGTWVDQVVTFVSTIGIGTPVFWIGILMIYIFAVWTHLLPMQGYTSPFVDFGGYIQKAIMPIFCLSIGMMSTIARQTRSNMLEVISQDYIRTARANGIPERKVIFNHALKNALIPVITIIGMQIGGVMGGSLLVEQVFNITGMGVVLTSAITSRDYLLIQNGVLIFSMITVACNLLTDVVYGLVDPRIRASRSKGA